jgi:hypothetical protein
MMNSLGREFVLLFVVWVAAPSLAAFAMFQWLLIFHGSIFILALIVLIGMGVFLVKATTRTILYFKRRGKA